MDKGNTLFRMSMKSHIYRISFAGMALIAGVCIYLIDRQPGTVYFIPAGLSLNDRPGSVFGILGNNLPAFLHVYIFILLTSVLFSGSRRTIIIICLGWALADGLLEISQIHYIALQIANNIPAWFADFPFLDNTANYFLAGTFDFLDLASIGLGALTAYVTIILTDGGREHVVHA